MPRFRNIDKNCTMQTMEEGETVTYSMTTHIFGEMLNSTSGCYSIVLNLKVIILYLNNETSHKKSIS